MADQDRGFKWTIWAFVASTLLMSGLAIWQLVELSPARWCALADTTSENSSACSSILLKLLELKDHGLIATFMIMGILFIALAVVALKVSVKGSGPGGFEVDIGADETVISNREGDAARIPTPPSA